MVLFNKESDKLGLFSLLRSHFLAGEKLTMSENVGKTEEISRFPHEFLSIGEGRLQQVQGVNAVVENLSMEEQQRLIQCLPILYLWQASLARPSHGYRDAIGLSPGPETLINPEGRESWSGPSGPDISTRSSAL